MPTIKANTPQPPPKDHSSERERRTPKTWSKGHKTACIAANREQVVSVDPARLPPDAACKGYEDVVVQDVVFHTDNGLFHKEKFYSPAQHTTSLASLPQGYSGQFGPGIKSLALVWFVSYRGGFPPDNVAQIPPKPLSIQHNDAKGSAT